MEATETTPFPVEAAEAANRPAVPSFPAEIVQTTPFATMRDAATAHASSSQPLKDPIEALIISAPASYATDALLTQIF